MPIPMPGIYFFAGRQEPVRHTGTGVAHRLLAAFHTKFTCFSSFVPLNRDALLLLPVWLLDAKTVQMEKAGMIPSPMPASSFIHIISYLSYK